MDNLSQRCDTYTGKEWTDIDTEIKNLITEIYVKKHVGSFVRKSQEKLVFLDDLRTQARPYCTNIITYNPNNFPATEFVFDFAPLIQQGITVMFRTKLAISKVADIFYIHHEFELPLNDPRLIAACLDGYDASAYTFEQQNFEEFIVKYLERWNQKRISLYELDEVIDRIPVPQNKLFGSQMTVENALFRDLYGLCEQGSEHGLIK